MIIVDIDAAPSSFNSRVGFTPKPYATTAPRADPRRARTSRRQQATRAASAVAVAIAAALAQMHTPRESLLRETAKWTPPSLTRDKILRAAELGFTFDVQLAGEELGTGSNVTSQDTVPFSLWVAARHSDSYEEALWTATAHPDLDLSSNAVSLFAVDRDTVGAIVGASSRVRPVSMASPSCGAKLRRLPI
jgi:ADP-ribosylglycohydrolase